MPWSATCLSRSFQLGLPAGDQGGAGWLGDLALSTALPGTPVLGRDAPRILPAGSVACPVVLRYRTAAGHLPAGEIPRTLAEITSAKELVVEVHRLPAVLPEPAVPA